jgi:hypothetical protein
VARPPARPPTGAFLGWASCGALAGTGVLAAATIGPVLLLAALAAAAVLLALPAGRTRSATGLVSGAGLPLLWVAVLNRSGPGQVCTATATSTACVQEWSPWPWAVAGVLLVAGGAALWAVARRGAARAGGGGQPAVETLSAAMVSRRRVWSRPPNHG